MGVGDDGERGVCGVVVHHVCATQGVGDWGVAVGQLDYGGVFRTYIYFILLVVWVGFANE
jgi:hypothetical protein